MNTNKTNSKYAQHILYTGHSYGARENNESSSFGYQRQVHEHPGKIISKKGLQINKT
jgi:hypothetical protein